MTETKYYAYFIPNGLSGVTKSWSECETIVKGEKAARFKSFKNKEEAEEWLREGASYKFKKALPEGIYFDAGTGRGEGVEISVTDQNGKDVLSSAIAKKLINEFGKHLLPKGKTNNYGELLASFYALEIAKKKKIKNIFGDSKLVIDYWSKGFIKKEIDEKTRELAYQVAALRNKFENDGGKVTHISGDDNPADLGFHK